jgi:hypothetical protein
MIQTYIIQNFISFSKQTHIFTCFFIQEKKFHVMIISIIKRDENRLNEFPSVLIITLVF